MWQRTPSSVTYSDQGAAASPKGPLGMRHASLDFAFTAEELGRIRGGELSQDQASELRAYGKRMLTRFPLYAAAGFLLISLFLIGRSAINGDLDASAFAVVAIAAGIALLLFVLMLPITYVRFLRQATKGKLNVIRNAEATFGRDNTNGSIIRFGKGTNQRSWVFPSAQRKRVSVGAHYDVYWTGDTLIYLEPSQSGT